MTRWDQGTCDGHNTRRQNTNDNNSVGELDRPRHWH
jgi:hypothetical protein